VGVCHSIKSDDGIIQIKKYPFEAEANEAWRKREGFISSRPPFNKVILQTTIVDFGIKRT
jgi:hypothetical protein